MACAFAGNAAPYRWLYIGVSDVLRPEGPAAGQVRQVWWWILFAVSAVIFVVVALLLVGGAIRRGPEAELERQDQFGTPLVWIGGIAVPLIVLGTVFGLSIANV